MVLVVWSTLLAHLVDAQTFLPVQEGSLADGVTIGVGITSTDPVPAAEIISCDVSMTDEQLRTDSHCMGGHKRSAISCQPSVCRD